jgi:hypothetical protein
MAPLSRYNAPNRSAKRRAAVDFPLAAGPSIVITHGFIVRGNKDNPNPEKSNIFF